jgi:curved DNA-binding protein
MADRDYYDILGLSRNASADEIKAAHRKLVRKFHPDANKNDPNSARKFAEVQQAYETLSDPERRTRYDQFGHAGPGVGVPPGGDYSGAGYGQADPFGPGDHFGADEFDPREYGFNPAAGQQQPGAFGDIFDQLFGERGAFGRGRRQRREPEEANLGDIEYPVTLTFQQAARGHTLPVQINRGNRTDTVEVKIPSGVKTGSRVRLRGRGGRGPTGPADLFIIVNVADHPYFKREGNDVLVEVPLSVYEAMLGAKVAVPTLDGPETLNIPAGVNSGTRIRMKGRGIKRATEQGDQFVVVKLVVPRSLDEADRETIESLARKHPVNARADVKW